MAPLKHDVAKEKRRWARCSDGAAATPVDGREVVTEGGDGGVADVRHLGENKLVGDGAHKF